MSTIAVTNADMRVQRLDALTARIKALPRDDAYDPRFAVLFQFIGSMQALTREKCIRHGDMLDALERAVVGGENHRS